MAFSSSALEASSSFAKEVAVFLPFLGQMQYDTWKKDDLWKKDEHMKFNVEEMNKKALNGAEPGRCAVVLFLLQRSFQPQNHSGDNQARTNTRNRPFSTANHSKTIQSNERSWITRRRLTS